MTVADPHPVSRYSDHSAAGSAADRHLVTAAWWLVLGLLWIALGWEVVHRGVDPDEFEHLHAAFSVSRGEVPYRDFFEHHAPALYFLVWPLFRMFGPEWSVLTAGRCVSLACAAATLLVMCSLARRLLGWRSGVPVATVLTATTVFHLKSIELRPDVPAMLLLTLALWMALRPSRLNAVRWPTFFSVGILCGLATAFTQKALVPAAGLALGMLVMASFQSPAPPRLAKSLLGSAIAFTLGGFLVWGVIFGLFAIAGAAESLWHSAFYQLWMWQVKSGRFEHLRPTLVADLSIWLAAICELAVGLWEIGRRQAVDAGRGIVIIAVSVCLLSLIVVKATFPQFYLLWFPWLVLLALRRWQIWFTEVGSGRWIGILVVGMVLVLGCEFFLINRTLQHPGGGAFGHLVRNSSSNSIEVTVWFPTLLLLVTSALLGYLLTRKLRLAVLTTVAIAGMSYGQLRIQNAVEWSQTPQRMLVETVNSRVGIDETVLDGFTGYGALRRHAYYFWWINEYSLALMTPEERGDGLLSVLQSKPPAAVLFERNLRLLPPRVVTWLEANYRPMQEPLWVPKIKVDEEGH